MRQQIAGLVLTGTCALVAGCTTVVGGTAALGDKSGAYGGVPVSVSALDGLLLDVGQINGAMGATAMKVWGDIRQMGNSTADVSDANCRAVDLPAQATVYADSGWTAIRGQQLDDAPDRTHNADHFSLQAVVAFPSPREAAAFYKSSAQAWSACSHHKFSDPQPGRADTVWTVTEVTNENGTLSAGKVQEDGEGWTCKRALTIRNNVAIDIETCSNSPGSAASDIAIQIAAKVNKL